MGTATLPKGTLVMQPPTYTPRQRQSPAPPVQPREPPINEMSRRQDMEPTFLEPSEGSLPFNDRGIIQRDDSVTDTSWEPSSGTESPSTIPPEVSEDSQFHSLRRRLQGKRA